MTKFESIIQNLASMESPVVAVIGSRTITPDELRILFTLMTKMYYINHNIIWQSGGAVATDESVEHLSKVLPDFRTNIYLPWNGYNGKTEGEMYKSALTLSLDKNLARQCEVLLDKYYMAVRRHSPTNTVRMLMHRNNFVMLGDKLDRPVDLVLSVATPLSIDMNKQQVADSAGGTGYGIRMAYDMGIPCYNLRYQNNLEEILAFIK